MSSLEADTAGEGYGEDEGEMEMEESGRIEEI